MAWQFKKLFFRRLLTENLLVFFIQYSGLNISTLQLHPSPLWFATGTACAYLFLRGFSVLPGIFAGSFLAWYLAGSGLLLALGGAALFSLQAILVRWFNYRFLRPTLIFYELRDFIKFMLFVAVLTGFLSFILFILCYSSMSSTSIPFQLWVQWWLANLNAILIFSCAFITWDAYFPSSYSMKQPNKMQLLLNGGLIFFTVVLMFSCNPVVTLCFALLNLVLVVAISALFGWYNAMTASFLSGTLLSFAAFMAAPVFSTSFSSLTMIFLQLFLFLETVLGLSCAIKRNKGY